MQEKLTYERLSDLDILTPQVLNVIRAGVFQIRQIDGKIKQDLPPGMEADMPWIFVPGEDERNCRLWSQVYLPYYHIVPRGCFNCWKVVFRPRTLKELFTVRKLQKKLGLHGKCGMELRRGSTFKGLWVAFWYAPLSGGLEWAKELHKQVERAVQHELGMQNRVILKRACTEMEDMIGPSEKWFFPEVQHTVEDYLNSIWEVEKESLEQPDFLKIHIFRRWIEYAWENRDPSVEEFVESLATAFGVVPTSRFETGSGTKPEQSTVFCEDKGLRPSLQGLSDYL